MEHVPRNSNEKADALVAVATSLPIKETVLLPVYYQSESSITTNRVNEIDETGPSWITLIARYLSSGELPDSRAEVSRPLDPGPTRLADPNRSSGRDAIYTIYCILYCTGTLIDLSFLRAVPVPVVYKQFL